MRWEWAELEGSGTAGLWHDVGSQQLLHTALMLPSRPCPLLVQHVDAGWLGKKSGRGVYSYSRGGGSSSGSGAQAA